MAKKRLDVITELYAEAVGDVTEKPENWMAFLKSASRNYRLPFDEQVLIHAQRPDAEAVLTMDGWNKKFGRWVKRDSKGIAVIDKSGSRMKLKYYFDISDTQESRYKRLVRPVPLWEVKEEHREEVKETLANAFDVTAGKEFAEVIKEAAAHAAEDNLTDYMGDMMDALEGSALEGLDGENVAVRAKALLSTSIGYMVMARCGLDTETFFDKEDFEGIAEFHAQRLAGIFGTVTSDVAEMALSQISDTISKIQTEEKRRNRTFADQGAGGYIGDTDKIYTGNERGTSYERNRIQESGRLSSAGTYRTGGTGSTKWEIRFTQKELSERTQIRSIPEPDDGREVKRTSEENTGRSTGEVSVSDRGDETVAESDGGTESERPDEVGGTDEQHPSVSGGNGTEGTGLRIEDAPADTAPEKSADKGKNSPVDMLPEAKEESGEKEQKWDKETEAQRTGENKSDIGERKKYDRESEDYSKIDFLKADDLLNLILLSAPDIKDRKEEIQAFYESHEERAERKEYIMRLFRNGITEYTLDNGETVGHEPYEDALHLWRGKYEDRTEQGYYHWLVITEIFEGMRLFGKLSDRGIMTTADGQLSLMGERAGEDTPAFSFPQEFIDHVLCRRGSGIEGGKFRIYSYFLQGHGRAEREAFLKKEYGIGGCSPIITGTGVSESHDAKGIEFRKGYGDDAPRLLLSWGTVAKRIDELIRAERYMTRREKELLPEYEKSVLSAEIYHFFRNQPDNVIRPYPHRADYSMGMKAIRPQLDMPQRLDTIIQTMAEVLNNTADFARNYPSMQKAYHDLLDYKAGTYSLFTPIPDERGGIETLSVPQVEIAGESTDTTEPEKIQDRQEESTEKETQKEQKENTNAEEKTISDEATEKDTEEKAEQAASEEEKEEKAIEPENEKEVIKTDTAFSESGKKTSLAERLNELYKEMDYYGYKMNLEQGEGEEKVIPQIEEQLANPDEVSAIHVYLIDIKKETEPETEEYLKLENMIQEVEALPAMKPPYDLKADTVIFLGTKEYQIDFISEKMVVLRDVEFPLFTEELDRNVFEERLRENPANDHLKIKEPIPFLPAEKDNTFSESAGGFSEKQTERGEEKTEENSGGNAEENPEGTVQKEGKENQKTEEEAEEKEQAPDNEIQEEQAGENAEKEEWISESDFPIGAELEMDGRKFAIDSVDIFNGEVSLRDITFRNRAGFPIFRSESVYVVRDILEKQTIVKNLLKKEEGGERQEEKIGEQPEEIPEEELTTVQKNYRLLMELAPEVLDGEQFSKTFEAGEGFMPLTIEAVDEDRIAVSHYYVENGDSMADPDMEFFADHETESLHAMTFQQDNMNVFYNVGASGEGSEELAEELNDFANQWFRNIKNQGYREIVAEKEQERSGQEEQINNTATQESATTDVIPVTETDTAERSDTKITPAFLQKKSKRNMVYDLHPEIPQAERNQFHITDDTLGYGTPREKFRKNIMAIQLLKKCEAEDRFATPDEQKILSEYVGWGGLSDAFDETKSSWETEFLELKTVLDEEEYAAARVSTLTAFYTPPVVIRAIWQALEDMGLQAGNILEPSCGIGNFIGMKPENLSDCKMYGVEIDSISGRIARQLYQKSSVLVQGYEDVALPDSFFDVAVGNVPFGQFGVSDKRYDKNRFHIHDYFFAKTLDKVRPGGVIVFVTSSWTMDKRNSSVRKYIAQRAELLGAVRLPDNTFLKNAGTDVTSDILFLQKRDRMVETEPDWLYLDTDKNGLTYNQYFIEHPEMVLGEMAEESSQYGMRNTCRAYEDKDLNVLLQEAVRNIHAEITEAEMEEMIEEEDRSIPADPTVTNFSFAIYEGEIYYRENSRMKPVELSVTGANRVRGMIAIRDCVRELISYQTEGYGDEVIADAQKKLNELYDVFRKRYGLLNDRGNRMVFSEDNSYPLLCSLEILKEDGTLERKADLFTKRTIKPHEVVEKVETAGEALSISLSEKAGVDMEYMCSLTGKSAEEIEKELSGAIFRLPDAEGKEPVFVSEDEYLSGNVREKLRVAELAAETSELYRSNVEALKKVQPEDLPASEISVRLGTTWIPEGDISGFIFELLDTPYYTQPKIKVHFSRYTGEWQIEGKSVDKGNMKAVNTYGTDRANAYRIIEDSLNLRDTKIFDYVIDDDGKRKPVLNKKETAIAQGKQDIIKQEFKDWIWKEPERRQRLTEYYNEHFNAIRPREYDGSHLRFYGINPEITLRKHQLDGVARIIYGGNTLLAYVVGAGKTYTMVAAAMESRRLGLCSKSMVVVPNHIIEQFAAEWMQLYPAANILVATKKDFETKNRKKFCARIATSEIDAVIIGHSQFEKIPLSAERQRRELQRQINEIVLGIKEIKEQNGERFTIKQLEKTKKNIEQRIEKLNDQSGKDDVVTFEELGIDRLFVDEADGYKNLFLHTKMRNVGGITQTEAKKSSDMFMKCRYLDEITGGKGIIFATGTPVSNSIVELYTMQRYLQYGELERHNLQHFDAWASTFGETVTAIELAPEGTGYRLKTRFAKFFNLPELMQMFREVADIRTADMLDLPVPEAEYRVIATKPSGFQKEMVADLGERAERVRNKMVDPRVDNMLKITNDGRKLALDQRLADEMLPDEAESKVNACADEVYRFWEDGKEEKLTQLVFCDLSTPKNDGTFSVYNALREKLTTKGIPENEIAFIHEANTEVKKKELFSKVRSGAVRVLMGSTFKMGAGTNVQDRIIASHDLDCPWRPRDLEQRAGRTVRQGNRNKKVDIIRYVTEGTFDAYLYQVIENKQKFISQIMTSRSPARTVEDIDETALSYAEIKALATGNPYIKEKMDLDVQVSKLQLLKQSFLSQKYDMEDKVLKKFPQEIKVQEALIIYYQSDIETAKENTPESRDIFPPMEIKGTVYHDKKEAGQALIEACKALSEMKGEMIGKYRGFYMELSYSSYASGFTITLQGKMEHKVALGTDIFGNVTRLDNEIEKFPDRMERCRAKLENLKLQMENGKKELEKEFPHEKELAEKTARLAELNVLLDMDKKDHVVMDEEPEEEREEGGREKEKER